MRFEPSRLRHRQIRIGDVPAFCRDLVLDDPVFHLRAANPRPAFESREEMSIRRESSSRSRRYRGPTRRRRRSRRETSCRCPGRRSACRGGCRPSSAALKLPFSNRSNARKPLGSARRERDDHGQARRPCPDGCRSGRRFPSVPAPPTPATSVRGARSPAPFSRTAARRRKAPAAAGSSARRQVLFWSIAVAVWVAMAAFSFRFCATRPCWLSFMASAVPVPERRSHSFQRRSRW